MLEKMDFMAIGAHADDVEIAAAGTIAKMTAQGKKGVIVDLTDSSMSTNGTPVQRIEEAQKSAQCLGIERRENLGLFDSNFQHDFESQNKLITLIRKYRPKIILTHSSIDDHPDHLLAYQLVKTSWFKAGLKQWNSNQEPFRPGRLFYFESVAVKDFKPSFCVDISSYFETKLKSLQCYSSQFKEAEYKTDLNSPTFLESIEVRNRFYGLRIKKKWAEAFQCEELPEMDNLTELGSSRFS